MPAPDDAVRARRRLTNKFIAAHEAARLRPFFDRNVKVIVGDGALIVGADEVTAAFDAQFKEPGFIAYVRETSQVEIDQDGSHASERGRWTGRWADRTMTGDYLAVWRKTLGQWVIESELFVTLTDQPA
jgi:hypothetical protein